MNKSTLEYKAYTGLLEGKITAQEHKTLINEFGFLTQLGASLKSLKQAGSQAWGGLKTLYNNNAFKNLSVETEKEVSASIKKLRDIGKKLEIPEEELNFIISKLLTSSSGITAQDVVSASKNKIPPAEEDAESSGEQQKPGAVPVGEVPTGTKVEPSSPTYMQSLVQMAAAASDKPIENVADEVNKKKINAESLKKLMASICTKATGVPTDSALKVINALMATGHLTESSKTQVQQENSSLIFERWQRLAGIAAPKGILAESPGALKYAMAQIRNGKVTDVLDLNSILKNAKKGKLSNEEAEQVVDELEKKNIVKPEEEQKATEELNAAMEDVPESAPEQKPAEDKESANDKKPEQNQSSSSTDKANKEKPTGNDKKSQPVEKKAAEALKRFKQAADDVQKKLGDEVAADQIGQVLDWLDKNDIADIV